MPSSTRSSMVAATTEIFPLNESRSNLSASADPTFEASIVESRIRKT